MTASAGVVEPTNKAQEMPVARFFWQQVHVPIGFKMELDVSSRLFVGDVARRKNDLRVEISVTQLASWQEASTRQ